MPRLSQWYVKLSFGYLLAGFTVGALLLANKGRPLHPALWSLLPAHIEWLLLGWVAQLTLGVAFWILPRFWKEPRRGNTTGAYVALLLPSQAAEELRIHRGLLTGPAAVVVEKVLWRGHARSWFGFNIHISRFLYKVRAGSFFSRK